jgi:spermidine synthase
MSDAPGSSETIMITVAERKSRFGAITILKRKETGSLLYVQGDSFQSEADENGISLVGYIHAIFGLVQQSGAKRVLMIGCGGGTLATMLARIGCMLTVVDIDPHAFLLARRYFRFPENITCRVADGCQYLLSEQDAFDAVVLDAFRGGFMPDHLTSSTFFALVRPRLTASGSIFVNVHVENDLDDSPDQVAAAMASAWPDVRILDREGHDHRNAIVMAGDVSELERPALKIRPAIEPGEIIAELDAMQFRAIRRTSR